MGKGKLHETEEGRISKKGKWGWHRVKQVRRVDPVRSGEGEQSARSGARRTGSKKVGENGLSVRWERVV